MSRKDVGASAPSRLWSRAKRTTRIAFLRSTFPSKWAYLAARVTKQYWLLKVDPYQSKEKHPLNCFVSTQTTDYAAFGSRSDIILIVTSANARAKPLPRRHQEHDTSPILV